MNDLAPPKSYHQKKQAFWIECRQHALCITAGLWDEIQYVIYFLLSVHLHFCHCIFFLISSGLFSHRIPMRFLWLKENCFLYFFFIFPTLTFLNQTTSKVQHKLSAVWKLLSGLGMDFLLELMGVEIKEVKYRVKSFCLFARYSSLPLYHTWPCHQPSSVCRNTLSDFIYDLCKTLSNVPLWLVSSHVFSAWCLQSSKIFTSQPWVLCYYWPS